MKNVIFHCARAKSSFIKSPSPTTSIRVSELFDNAGVIGLPVKNDVNEPSTSAASGMRGSIQSLTCQRWYGSIMTTPVARPLLSDVRASTSARTPFDEAMLVSTDEAKYRIRLERSLTTGFSLNEEAFGRYGKGIWLWIWKGPCCCITETFAHCWSRTRSALTLMP